MSRRRRAALLIVASVVSAVLGVMLVGAYSDSVSDSFGRMRSVVVVSGRLPEDRTITAGLIRGQTEVRQVPARFVPAGALSDPAGAIGFEAAAPLVAGSYLTAGILRRPQGGEPSGPRIGSGRIPVELNVSGAAALSRLGARRKVDVLVTRERRPGRSGATSLAAAGVPLIAVGGGDPADSGTGLATVVLGLTREQAIELIDAEAFARRLTVIPGRRR